MKKDSKNLLLVILLCFSSSISWAEESQNQLAKYVNISVEINGLNESIDSLKKASQSLSETMKKLEKRENLEPQDLQHLDNIAAHMQAVSENIDKTLLEIGPAIQQAEKPALELVSSVTKEARVQAIDPVITSVQNTISKSVDNIKLALIWVAAVVFAGLLIFGFFIFKTLKQLNQMTSTVREIFTKGEFTYRLKDES